MDSERTQGPAGARGIVGNVCLGVRVLSELTELFILNRYNVLFINNTPKSLSLKHLLEEGSWVEYAFFPLQILYFLKHCLCHTCAVQKAELSFPVLLQ